MNGITFLKKIRANKSRTQPKFIFSTGRVNLNLEEGEGEAKKMIDGLLQKPFNEDDIAKVLIKI